MAKERKVVSYPRLGGMRTDKPITELDAHEALTARNTRMSTTGRIVRRKGGGKYNATQLAGAGNVLGLYQFKYATSGDKFLVAENTKLMTDTGSVRNDIKTGLTAGKYYSFSTFRDLAIVANGTDTVMQYDGTTVSNLSMTVPSVGTMTAIQTLTAAYSSISNANPAVGTSTAHGLKTGDKIRLTTTGSLPTGLSTGTDYYIVRTGADTMNFCPTLADALAGTNKIATSGAGSGTHTWVIQPTTTGNLTLLATYQYVVTFYNSSTFQESNPFTLSSAISITLASTNQKVYLQDIPVSADPNVTARRIYRTTANGSIYNAQLVYTITDNTTTTYLDTTADVSLGSIIALYKDPSPIFQKTVVHKNRLFGFKATDSILYFSYYNTPWYWPQGITDLSLTAKIYTIPVGQGDGDVLTNIVSFYDYLLVFKTKSVWVLRGFDETDFSITKLEFMNNVGCVGFRSARVVKNHCYFIDYNGIYRTDGSLIEYIGAPMQGFFDPSSSATSEKINASKLGDSVVVIDNRKPLNCIRFSMASGSSNYNDLTIIYDYEDNQWFYDTGYSAQSYCLRNTSGIDYVMRGDDYGYIYTENYQEGDGGVITSTSTGGNTSNTLKDTSLSMTVDFYKGVYIEILSGTNYGEKFRILSNTSNTFTIDGTWTVTPDTTSVYTVGGIDFYYLHKWDNYGNPATTKRWQFVRPRFDADGEYTIITYYLYDFQQPIANAVTLLSSPTLFDVSVFDVALFDAPAITQNLQRTPASEIHNWSAYGISHKPAGQVVKLNGYDKIFQEKGLGIR